MHPRPLTNKTVVVRITKFIFDWRRAARLGGLGKRAGVGRRTNVMRPTLAEMTVIRASWGGLGHVLLVA